jgi:hypothetical protein
MLEYYLPGLDVSTLSDEQFIAKVGWLVQIRQLEAADQVNRVFKNITGE